MNLLDYLQIDGFTLKHVATTNGGEYAGACPFCGGRDRFRVWPEEDGGRFWCRGCGKAGDAIQFLRDFRGLSFKEACLELGQEPSLKQRQEHREVKKPLPSSRWQGKAGEFLKEAVETLWKTKEAVSFLHGRGLRDETIQATGLGWNLKDVYESRESWGLEPQKDEKGNLKKLWLPTGLVIPLIQNGRVIRLRIRRPEGEPRYYIVSGSDMKPMSWKLGGGVVVVVESELDGLLIEQEAGDLAGVVALGSAQARPDTETNKALRGAASILVSLDFDEAGARAAWQYWLQSYPNARRWPTPHGKDPTEAAQQGLNVRAWVEAGLTTETLIEPKLEPTEAMIKPFPKEWLKRYDEEQLERLAIMTVDGRLSDQEAVRLLN